MRSLNRVAIPKVSVPADDTDGTAKAAARDAGSVGGRQHATTMFAMRAREGGEH